jgi:hypothetical protein
MVELIFDASKVDPDFEECNRKICTECAIKNNYSCEEMWANNNCQLGDEGESMEPEPPETGIIIGFSKWGIIIKHPDENLAVYQWDPPFDMEICDRKIEFYTCYYGICDFKRTGNPYYPISKYRLVPE